MLEGFEQFCKDHEKTIAFVEAVSTLAVVVVSVALAFLSQRANRTRIRTLANRSLIQHSTLAGRPNPRYVTVNITNLGILPVSIGMSFFAWKLPFTRGGIWVMPWDYAQHDEWVPQKKYPAKIEPRTSESFFLHDMTTFREAIAELMPPKANALRRLRGRFLRAYVITDDGRRFRVRFGEGLRQELRALR